MEGRRLLLVEEASIAALDAAITRLRSEGCRSFLLLACEADDWDPALLSSWLESLDVAVFGGIFPGLVQRAQWHRHGSLIMGFPERLEIVVVRRLSDRAAVEPQLLASAALLEAAPSLMVLFDGLCPHLEAFVECLYAIVGGHAVVVGGGAGHGDLVQRPCLLCNAGVLEDAALLVALPGAIAHGVAHGWQRLSGPFLVTRSQGNVLAELNYQPAFAVYRKEVEAHSGQQFADTDFFSIAKTYPLGIEGVDGDFLVRDPIKRAGDALICVGELPQNATVFLLKGDAAALIASAGEAALAACRESRQHEHAANASVALVFDCISRALFLGAAITEELAVIESTLADCEDIFGALSLGEISSSRAGVIELMNKSTVVALIGTSSRP
ncbi:MAG TPA: FIST N-terminal domain-containing protein [Dokdonella sp.]|uniref:FIST signal transduction protein n=6 Tax=Dokdonella sp. TaxID=2291710 RepID=UPI002C0E09F6|nr:FIST N-terminal domain-containing protein [Dokdonella sp.]